MAKKKIHDLIAEWMEPFGRENGYELSRTEFVKEGQTWYLRVYIDKLTDGAYDYVGSDDCAKVSAYLSDKLDEADPISQNYYLEVSSPGMDRPLLSEKDFERFKGEIVEIKLYEAMDGTKHLEGTLKGLTDGIIYLETENGKIMEIPREKTSKVNLAVVF